MTEFPGCPVIVLGMGRSGTSLVSSLLRALGVHLGDQLLEAGFTNPRGYFEDTAILELHRSWLQRFRSDADWDNLLSPLIETFHPDLQDYAAARQILQRLSQPGYWGWKEPRTINFIHFWLALLPNAKVIVPLRHPLDVFYSYLKRAAFIRDLGRPEQILHAYAEQHNRIAESMNVLGLDALVVYVRNAFQEIPQLVACLCDFLGMQEPTGTELPTFAASELSALTITPAVTAYLHSEAPNVIRSFERLNTRAVFSFEDRHCDPQIDTSVRLLMQAVKGRRPSLTEASWLPLVIDLIRGEDPSYFSAQSSLLARHSDELASLRAWNLELQKGVKFWQDQAIAWEAQAQNHGVLSPSDAHERKQ